MPGHVGIRNVKWVTASMLSRSRSVYPLLTHGHSRGIDGRSGGNVAEGNGIQGISSQPSLLGGHQCGEGV